jgi:hypothetical protein
MFGRNVGELLPNNVVNSKKIAIFTSMAERI